MSRMVQAVKHYGCPKKRYKFEMHIHRVVLTSEKRKLFTRVLWTRGKKHAKNQRFRTKWCEGVENYKMDESVYHTATIYFTSNTNQVQSKPTTITLQIRERIDSKDVKFAKFELNLSKYVDVSSPHRVFYQRLNYEKARKKAQLIFTIKSVSLTSDGNVSDYTDNEDDEELSQSQSNLTDYDDNESSVLSVTSINTLYNANSTYDNKAYPSPVPHTKPHKTSANDLAIHSNISGHKLKHRNYKKQTKPSNQPQKQTNRNINTEEKTKEVSPTPPSVSDVNITITRRGSNDPSTSHQDTEKFVRHVRSPRIQLTPKHHVNSSGSHDRIMQLQDIINAPSPTAQSTSVHSVPDVDVAELKKKLKLFEDKHKKYKYKYARLCKKVEEQEIEQQCQKEEICRLKRVEEDMKSQRHTLSKYRKKIKSLSKERESLKKTLQKRNQTIINLNKESSKFKQQIMSLQTLESVRYNSDVEEHEEDDHHEEHMMAKKHVSPSQGVYILTAHQVDHDHAKDGEHHDAEDTQEIKEVIENNVIIKEDEATPLPPKTYSVSTVTPQHEIALPAEAVLRTNVNELIQKLTTRAVQQKETNSGHGDGELSPEIMRLLQHKQILLESGYGGTQNVNDMEKQWMLAETEKANYKKMYEKEKVRVNHYRSKTDSVNQKYEKAEIELSIARHELEELRSKYEVMEEVYAKLKQDLTRMMDRYSKLEVEHDRMHDKMRQSGQCFIDDDDDNS
eukprot:537170_1